MYHVCSQMLGENVLGALQEFAAALQRQDAHPLRARDAEGSVYFDILSTVMVGGTPLVRVLVKLTISFALWRGPTRLASGKAAWYSLRMALWWLGLLRGVLSTRAMAPSQSCS